MVLFHDGLGGRERDEKKRELLGNIPYLNGGMFEVHELEQKYGSIRIHNSAFKEIFDFFDQYKWHLDINPNAPGNEINPDVLGYIFEKYINQRAEMGAYYTKEDITGYIGKNTILPFLFDEVKRKYPEPFKENGEVWQFIKNSGDDYIYPAMKFGIPETVLESPGADGLFDDLPEEIKTGLDPEQEDLWKIRKPWNKPAPNDIALPTEIYREVIERRGRYKEVKSIITSGSIKEINDLITYNLDIIDFTEDLLRNTQNSKLIEHFYRALEKVTILDPTCGSGAFLFAAMNILEPIYEILIERMRSFVYDEDRINAEKYASRKGGFLFKYPFFREVLGKVSGLKDPEDPESGQNHPNQKYFILKSIILNNLYGVDIMREAVEIAKLRLFLKLVAQVHPDPEEENMGIEPLPDMDFNLKTGNTLVGFGTKSEIDSLSSLLVDDKEREKIYTECDKISRIFESFKEAQLSHGETNLLKKEIKERIENLNDRLDILLYTAHYGGGDYALWHSSHKPFHWFAEFYEILDNNGGFDVIIGNPPYVEYNAKKFPYRLLNYITELCGNLYAFVLERSITFSNKNAILSFIVPVSFISTDGYSTLRELYISEGINYFSSFNIHPSRLFEGAYPRLAINILLKSTRKVIYSTRYHKWFEGERDSLFDRIFFLKVVFRQKRGNLIPKSYSKNVNAVFERIMKIKSCIGDYQTSNDDTSKISFYYRRAFGAFILFYDKIPLMYDSDGRKVLPSELKTINFPKLYSPAVMGIYYSNLFYSYIYTFSDCRNINKPEIENFPIELDKLGSFTLESLSQLTINLISDLAQNSKMLTYRYHTGERIFQAFYPRLSKNIIDEIDVKLAEIYDLSNEELDAIVSYDIKYRIHDDNETD